MSENNDFVVNMMDFMDLQCKDQSNNKKKIIKYCEKIL